MVPVKIPPFAKGRFTKQLSNPPARLAPTHLPLRKGGVCYIISLAFRGVAQMVARSVRDAEVARSNRVAPTKLFV